LVCAANPADVFGFALDVAKWLGFLVGAGPELPDHRRAFLDHGSGPAAFWHRPDAKLIGALAFPLSWNFVLFVV
jgi:hypothetical protein